MIRPLQRLALALALVGCGASTRDASGLRAELEATLEAARSHAAPTVSDAEAALDEADRAEALGDLPAAAEHRARARLLAAQATALATLHAEDEARAELEAETAQLLEEALTVEHEAEALEADAARLAAARAARDEGLRALSRAEADEARGRRVGRLSLDDAAAMRNAARDIRQRARLLLAAAIRIAEPRSVELTERAEAERLLAASEAAEAPLDGLTQADAAHDAARAALGRARRGLPITEASVAALREACESEGFAALQLERGVSIDVSGFLSGRTPSREGAARLARLASLALAHPEGPISLEAPSEAAPALTSALVAGGVARERIAVTSTEGASRVIFSAYAPPTPATAARLLGEPSEGGIHVDARPAPASSEE